MNFSKFWNKTILGKLLKTPVMEERTYFALTLITGFTASLIAVGIYKATHYLTEFFHTQEAFDLKAFLFGGLAIFISGFITTRIYPSTSGSGIPGVRVALAVFHGKITFPSTIAKLLTSILSLSSGMSLGREGPTAAIAAGVGSALGQTFHLSKKKVKALVAIGAAGGIAAAFNAPIAAVVFTLEEVVGDLNAKILGSIIISSVVAAITAQALMGGNTSTFTEIHYTLAHPAELIFYLAVGLAASVAGPLWIRSVLKLRASNMKIFRGHRLTIIMLTFGFMAAISFIRPEILGSGHETIEDALLSLLLDWKLLLVLFGLKFFATALCYASGISGGLFLPTLLIGAMLGSLIGALAQLGFPDLTSNTGAYALVGMGAFFASVIRAPFTSIIMLFEMTRDYNIILPLMIANATSYLISGKFHKESIYESISEQDGIHLPSRDDHDILESLTVEDAMIHEPFSFDSNMTIKEAFHAIKEQPFSGFPVVMNGFIMGVVSKNEIGANYAKGNGSKLIIEIAERKVISIYPDQSLLVALHKLERFHVSRLPVVSRINDKKIIGIITAENIVSKFGFHIEQGKETDLSEYEKEFLNLENVEDSIEDYIKEESQD